MNTKLAILYERLSHEDARENESVSIENQKAFLEDYAIKNGFTNFIHLTDDGWSGTRWDRPGFLEMMSKVESGNVGAILIKDMSRLGRDHLRVGLFLEQLREQGIQLIAVAENIDTAKGEDDFMPFRNIIAEWHARDTSRKIRAIFGARTAQGKYVTGAVVYGYLRDPNDKNKWILDEEAAPIVERIFHSIIAGKTMTQIADELTAENVLIPMAHWEKIGVPMKVAHANPTMWSVTTIATILAKEEYMGWKILNKTIKETYKSKRKANTPDNILIFKDAHPAIIDEETWNIVHRLRKTSRRPREKVGGAPNPLTGVIFCADCGAKLYNKRGKTGRNKPHDEYICSSYRHSSRTCTSHYIRTEVMQNLILETIRRVSKYVRENETEFVERVRAESELQQENSVKESRKKLAKHKRRREEINSLIKKLYETFAAEQIPEKHFTELLAGYDTEQTSIDGEIAELEKALENYNADSVKADKFIELVKKHTEFNEFSALLLNEFIEKVIVHEAVKIEGKRTMQVDIYLNFIGKIDLPELAEPIQEEMPERTSRKKLRKDMTEEQRERQRAADRRYYAKKKAARIAAEQAERAKILEGTKYEIENHESEVEKYAS